MTTTAPLLHIQVQDAILLVSVADLFDADLADRYVGHRREEITATVSYRQETFSGNHDEREHIDLLYQVSEKFGYLLPEGLIMGDFEYGYDSLDRRFNLPEPLPFVAVLNTVEVVMQAESRRCTTTIGRKHLLWDDIAAVMTDDGLTYRALFVLLFGEPCTQLLITV